MEFSPFGIKNVKLLETIHVPTITGVSKTTCIFKPETVQEHLKCKLKVLYLLKPRLLASIFNR